MKSLTIDDVLAIASNVKKEAQGCLRWVGDARDPLLSMLIPDRRLKGRSCGNPWCINPDHAVRRSEQPRSLSNDGLRSGGRPTKSLEEVLMDKVQGYPDPDACWSSLSLQASYNGGVCSIRDLAWYHVTGVQLPPRPKFILDCGTPKCLNPRHARRGQPGINYGSLTNVYRKPASSRKF